eukprot:scaffold96069_cov72-Phaeocystis_antarctica.AAC.3
MEVSLDGCERSTAEGRVPCSNGAVSRLHHGSRAPLDAAVTSLPPLARRHRPGATAPTVCARTPPCGCHLPARPARASSRRAG